MSPRAPLIEAEKERIYQGKLQGRTLSELAVELQCSYSCVRKWWRKARDERLRGLRSEPHSSTQIGILSRFDPRVAQKALALKRSHKRWGADRVLVALRTDPELQGLELPSRSRLAAFFKERCPECIATRKPRPPAPPSPPRATGVHEVWQLDNQEGIRLQDGSIATLCNIRDPVGAAMIASRAFSVKTARHWRKLTWTEVRQVLRDAFTEWQTLPDCVQTDNELVLTGSPTDPFPSLLTLWLVGLGIRHRTIRPHCPTDQPHVERNHRTLDDFALNEESLAGLASLQQALDRERQMYNELFPSQASDCAGHPPLGVHPELLRPRRPYRPEWELALFDIQRVYDYLATFTFQRKVSASGQVSVGRQIYSVGRARAGASLSVRFDPGQRQWVFLAKPEEDEDGEEKNEKHEEGGEVDAHEVARRDVKNLDIEILTGLDPQDFAPIPPIQLTLPCFVA
jgi:transposase-like protein